MPFPIQRRDSRHTQLPLPLRFQHQIHTADSSPFNFAKPRFLSRNTVERVIMGGGGVLRTAAKVAGLGGASVGLRGVPVSPPAEQSIGRASRPVPVVLSSDGSKSADAAPLYTAASWDLDEWDLARDDGLVTPRVVFGEVPSFQEAKAAASELKNAVDEVYQPSSNASVGEGSAGSEVSVRSPLLPGMDTKSSVIEAISTPSMPKHALQAFKFLSTNSDAQTIVASVVSDPNVWNAVMKSPSLKDFIQSKQTAAGLESEESSKILEKLDHYDQKDNQENGFMDFMEIMRNFKVSVTDMVSNVSKYFNNLFGVTEEKTSSGANRNRRASFMDDFAMGGTLMGLAVMVVMVVLLKRA